MWQPKNELPKEWRAPSEEFIEKGRVLLEREVAKGNRTEVSARNLYLMWREWQLLERQAQSLRYEVFFAGG